MMDLFTLLGNGNISANHIAPGKRGRSSVSPIMVRDREGQVALLAGGAGSRRIITATSFVSTWLYLNETNEFDSLYIETQHTRGSLHSGCGNNVFVNQHNTLA